MKIYGSKTVFDAALDRIRYLFDEFDEVVVNFSGGKDSTVCLFLSLIVAREKNKLPLKLLWIDQESEWQGTVDICTQMMTMPEIQPMWYQMPMVITNNVSSANRYSHCWAPEDEAVWVHKKHEISIKENTFDEVRFHHLFNAIIKKEFSDKTACFITGVRAEESPNRYLGLTNRATYKWITWGKTETKEQHFSFHPIFDWTYRDVWKAIHENAWRYNRVYDEMYRMGAGIRQMRISNLHHETAMQTLAFVQEIEPETWNRLALRIPGANAIKHLKKDSYITVRELPKMFRSWEEYARHLCKHMVPDPKNYTKIISLLTSGMNTYSHPRIQEAYIKRVIKTVLLSDWDFTGIGNFTSSPAVRSYANWKKGKWAELMFKSKYIPEHEKERVRNVLAKRN